MTRTGIKEILDRYRPSDDIFCEDSEKVRRVKFVVYNCLNEVDRRVILLYAELGTQRALAERLGVSASTVNKLLKEIRRKIYALL